ncbi:MAG: hypothetical protein ACHQAX_02840 [Gammaproteobacteria bacterium]
MHQFFGSSSKAPLLKTDRETQTAAFQRVATFAKKLEKQVEQLVIKYPSPSTLVRVPADKLKNTLTDYRSKLALAAKNNSDVEKIKVHLDFLHEVLYDEILFSYITVPMFVDNLGVALRRGGYFRKIYQYDPACLGEPFNWKVRKTNQHGRTVGNFVMLEDWEKDLNQFYRDIVSDMKKLPETGALNSVDKIISDWVDEYEFKELPDLPREYPPADNMREVQRQPQQNNGVEPPQFQQVQRQPQQNNGVEPPQFQPFIAYDAYKGTLFLTQSIACILGGFTGEDVCRPESEDELSAQVFAYGIGLVIGAGLLCVGYVNRQPIKERVSYYADRTWRNLFPARPAAEDRPPIWENPGIPWIWYAGSVASGSCVGMTIASMTAGSLGLTSAQRSDTGEVIGSTLTSEGWMYFAGLTVGASLFFLALLCHKSIETACERIGDRVRGNNRPG